MHLRIWLGAALALLTSVCASSAALAHSARPAQSDGVSALDGEWIYVEDRTDGRASEAHQPSMSSKVTLRVEKDAVVLVRSDGEIRMALDGTATDVAREGSVSRYSGTWKDGAFRYESVPVREPGDTRSANKIRWELRVLPEGMLASVVAEPNWTSVALYRHPQDIALPAPAKAAIGDIAWLAGAWVGTRGKSSIEERWTPPRGGSMLAVSRTVAGEKLRAFEYLRIVERNGGLVYVAQPNGAKATEFVLTELVDKRAVFENPRHDSPQRIVYELSAEGVLTASIGYAKGGKPQRFEFRREGG